MPLAFAAYPVAAGHPGRGGLRCGDQLAGRYIRIRQGIRLEFHQLADANLSIWIDDHDGDKGLLSFDAWMDL